MLQGKAAFAHRLFSALVHAGVRPTPAVVAREFNRRYGGTPVTLHAVRLWLLGKTMPRQDRLMCLAAWLGVEPHFLRDGAEVAQAVRERNQYWSEDLSCQERELFDMILRLPEPARNVVLEVVLALSRAHGLLPLATTNLLATQQTGRS